MRAEFGWRGPGDALRLWRGLVALAALVLCLAFTSLAAAEGPTHVHVSTLDMGGFNHACGVAVDSKGDVYVASAGESKIRVFNPAHTELTFIEDIHEPCGLAVNSKGELFVSEKATGKVVRYKPNAYPLTGSPTYGGAEAIDESGIAKGISIDRADDRLYVAEGTRIAVYKSDGSFEANVGEGKLSEATGVAAYTYAGGERYLFAADPNGAGKDKLYSFSGASVATLKLRREINGPKAGEDFGFGTAGAYLAVDPGSKCPALFEQACTAGHLLVYDEAHKAVEEFEASGEFLDRFTDEALEALGDAEPTGLAIDRSGGANDGTIYVSAGAAAGAKVLAFAPLAAPSRAPLPEEPPHLEPPSHVLPSASRVATDSHGDVYVLAGATIHVYRPDGSEIEVGPGGIGIEDPHNPGGLAVDSTGKVYVVDDNANGGSDETVTYYTPSKYPPEDGTTYTRHEPPSVTKADLGGGEGLPSIAVKPSGDHLFVAAASGKVFQFDSAAHGSKPLGQFAPTLPFAPHATIDVCGASGNVYLGENPGRISVINAAGTEFLARITGAGSPTGKGPVSNPAIAVDQSNCHVLGFDNHAGAAQEYDAAGGFVAEFAFPEPQGFSKEQASEFFGIAVDNSGGPSEGRAYVAFDDHKLETPDLWAFAPLSYGALPQAITGIADGVGGGNATLRGTVNPHGFELSECKFEYLLDSAYLENLENEEFAFKGAKEEDCAETLAEIGKGSAPVAVHADLSGLDPEARYRFRLAAKNKFPGRSEGKAGLFGPPLITAKSALPVLYKEATLRASIDPSGLASEYHFEYVSQEHFEAEGFAGAQSTPASKLAPGDGPVAVAASLTGLAEGTAYRFRAVAGNEAKAVVEGPDLAFTTLLRRPPKACPNAEYRTGLSANLPDCRAYELVTPAETKGLRPEAVGTGNPSVGFSNWLITPRGEGAGDRVAYFTFGTLPGFDGNGFLDGYRAQRGEGEHPEEGWRNELFGPTYQEAVPDYTFQPRQQNVAADQLYSFWSIEPAEALPGTLPKGIYLLTPNGATNLKCNPKLLQQADFELVGCGSLGTDTEAKSRYLSPGGAHVIFSSKAHLEEGVPPAGTAEALYDRAAGSEAAQVISRPPGGGAFGAGEDATYVTATEDGSTVLFKVGGTLYLRRGGQTTEIAEGPSAFAGVSEDGGRVFYAATGSITPHGNPKPATLYVCDVEAGPCAGTGAHAPTEIAEESVFVDVSADGSRAFFTATGNLYSWDFETQTTGFVSPLDPQDFTGFGGLAEMTLDGWTKAINPGGGGFSGRALAPVRSTPGGETFVFQSHAQLSAYDNGGRGEIYRYDPAAEAGEELLCVSCDPTGSPPSADAMLLDTGAGVDSRTAVPNLTDDGKEVFFQSPDRLLPEDANSATDVYEWQAKGAGECKRGGGCLALISSGQGELDSTVYGMSADGHDVFFLTRDKLVGADVSGSPSIYDARVEGGIPDPPAKEVCHGDACQGQGSQPPALAGPASTAPGTGDAGPEPSLRCAKGKRKVRRHGKDLCVKAHRKHKPRQRANHKGRASR